MNTRKNSAMFIVFATSQMQDETVKDNGQTTAGISHDLISNNELPFLLQEIFNFPFGQLDLAEKAIF